jgi:hypothetical protein
MRQSVSRNGTGRGTLSQLAAVLDTMRRSGCLPTPVLIRHPEPRLATGVGDVREHRQLARYQRVIDTANTARESFGQGLNLGRLRCPRDFLVVPLHPLAGRRPSRVQSRT